MNKFGILISLIICSFSFLSFRWPLENAKITSTFGESRGDHFHDGMDLISGVRKVYPLSGGKLLYSWNKALFPFDQYTGSGNYKIVKLSDNAGAVYLHLEDSESISAAYDENEPVAIFGNTGRSFGAHLHFSMIDMKAMSSVNPFTMLPETPDAKAPIVGPYALRIGDKIVTIKNNSKIRLTRDYPLLVKVIDVINGGEKLGIYKLNVVVNDSQLIDTTFERINGGKNGLTISGKNFDNLYDESGYYKVEGVAYRSGLNTVIVTATDFAGNKTQDNFTIDITLDR